MSVRALRGREAPAAVRVLAQAFFEDPAMVRVQPDERRRRKLLERWFAALALVAVRTGRRPLVGAFADGRLVGAHTAHEPGTYPPPPWTMPLHAPAMVPAGPPTTVRSLRWAHAREQVPPRSRRFLYLELLGTAPGQQGRGVGFALISRLLAEADARRLDVVLHTNTPRNVTYYERLGFVTTNEQLLPLGVPEWLMERPPA